MTTVRLLDNFPPGSTALMVPAIRVLAHRLKLNESSLSTRFAAA